MSPIFDKLSAVGDSKRERANRPPPITVEEFDRRAEAGEDLDEYFDWNSGVMVMPGELSPGQMLSLRSLAKEDASFKEPTGDCTTQPTLSVPLPALAVERLERLAKIRGVSQEDLAQLFIVQQLDQQEVLS